MLIKLSFSWEKASLELSWKKNKNKIPIITHIVELVYITESKVLFEYIWFCVMCGLTKCQESEELEKNVYLKIEALVKWLRI